LAKYTRFWRFVKVVASIFNTSLRVSHSAHGPILTLDRSTRYSLSVSLSPPDMVK